MASFHDGNGNLGAVHRPLQHVGDGLLERLALLLVAKVRPSVVRPILARGLPPPHTRTQTRLPSPPKAKVNRSQAIRDYLAKNAKASANEIKEALAKEGIKVSDSLISAVKYKKPKGKRGKKRGRPAGAASNGVAISIDSLVAAMKMVDQLGGLAAAEKLLAILRRRES